MKEPEETKLDELSKIKKEKKLEKKLEKQEKKLKKISLKQKVGGRTKETMFRTSLSNLVQLSNIADNKAGLMISVNAIIISIMVSFMVNQYESNPSMIWPTLLLVFVCLVTIMYAIMATMPSKNINSTKNNKDLDLLFFADYSKLQLEDYKNQMNELIKDDEKLSDQLLANMYAQGHVLTRKFNLLKIAYTVFMIGFPIVIILYLLVLSELI
jgi:hypothetical protein